MTSSMSVVWTSSVEEAPGLAKYCSPENERQKSIRAMNISWGMHHLLEFGNDAYLHVRISN